MKPEDLLLKELELRQGQSMIVAQGYIAFYAYFMTTNFVALGYLAQDPSRLKYPIVHQLAWMFLSGNILFSLGNIVLQRANLLQHRRSKAIIDALNTIDPDRRAKPVVPMTSMYPFLMFGLLLGLCSLSVLCSIWLWYYVGFPAS